MDVLHPPCVTVCADTMGGVGCMTGSRLPASTLLACVDAGNAWERIVESWPWLTPAHVEAAREYKQRLLLSQL